MARRSTGLRMSSHASITSELARGLSIRGEYLFGADGEREQSQDRLSDC